jgi:hypothetical protein
VERQRIRSYAERMARAIQGRDLEAIRALVAPGFMHRTHGGAAEDVDAFVGAIAAIPGEILVVRLDDVAVDLTPRGALVTGSQFAQVRIDGKLVEDCRGFVDWYVEHGGTWLIQAAVDLPARAAGQQRERVPRLLRNRGSYGRMGAAPNGGRS